MITAKSGHYAPTPDNMKRFVVRFNDIPESTVIQPRQAATFYRVGDFRNTGLNATALSKQEMTQWVGLYPFARSDEFQRVLDNITVIAPAWRPAPPPRT